MNRLVTLALLQVMTVPIAPWRIQHSLIVLALRAALILAIIALGACAGLPTGVVRPPSTARSDLSGTHLAAVARASLASSAAEASGFRLLPTGTEALTARLALAQRAQRTLDLQYYQLAHDHSGLHVLRSLHAAAQRGVRVRLLVDDLYAGGQDGLLAGLAAQPNIEVRLFNPLPARNGMVASRVVRSLHEFDRINRRMHNKLFVADNAWSISGGRNIADEYFDRAEPAHFIDLDILAAGAVVSEQSAVFDRYWNNAQAYPVASLLPQSASVAALRQDFERAITKVGARTNAPVPTLDGPAGAPNCALPCELDSGALTLHLAAAQVLADAPDKNSIDDDHASPTVAARYQALLDSAHNEVLLTTPYFVPGSGGLAALRAAAQRRVALSVVTNSLATTDEPLVHAGYARYRQALLAAGVRLFELMPSLTRTAERTPVRSTGYGSMGSMGRLHAKLAVVDRRWLFIGSMNLDRRSALINTEAALLIDSPALAAEAAQLLHAERTLASYRLQLSSDDHRIEWVAGNGPAAQVHATEPDASAGQRLRLWLASQFVAEDLL